MPLIAAILLWTILVAHGLVALTGLLAGGMVSAKAATFKVFVSNLVAQCQPKNLEAQFQETTKKDANSMDACGGDNKMATTTSNIAL